MAVSRDTGSAPPIADGGLAGAVLRDCKAFRMWSEDRVWLQPAQSRTQPRELEISKLGTYRE